jgi:hypothetical protein
MKHASGATWLGSTPAGPHLVENLTGISHLPDGVDCSQGRGEGRAGGGSHGDTQTLKSLKVGGRVTRTLVTPAPRPS